MVCFQIQEIFKYFANKNKHKNSAVARTFFILICSPQSATIHIQWKSSFARHLFVVFFSSSFHTAFHWFKYTVCEMIFWRLFDMSLKCTKRISMTFSIWSFIHHHTPPHNMIICFSFQLRDIVVIESSQVLVFLIRKAVGSM